jgi:membrane-anchored protein YejM (alkaline phosphatase superfamily)
LWRAALVLCTASLGAGCVTLAYAPYVTRLADPGWARFETYAACFATSFIALAALWALCVLALAPFALLRTNPWRHSSVVFGVAASFATAGLYVDFRIFRLTRLHLDRGLLEMLAQPDAFSAIGLGRRLVATAVLQLAGVVVLTFALLGASAALARRWAPAVQPWTRRVLLALLALATVDRASYAVLAPTFGGAEQDVGTVLPWGWVLAFQAPPELSFDLLGLSRGGADTALRAPQSVTSFEYPKGSMAEAATKTGPPPPDIVLLALESLNPAYVDPATMPHLSRLASESLVARRHVSGSNCTHLALFSLLYGLYPWSWPAITAASRPPATLELFRRLGYDVSVTSSNTAAWFGIEHLAFRPEWALGDFNREVDPDAAATSALERYVTQPHQRPYFAFLFLNETHFPYSFPPDESPFRPFLPGGFGADELDPARRTEVVNRYRNALHYADRLVGSILSAIERSGRPTVVVVTGDHGESFWDDGRLFHTSLLSSAQLRTPLIVRIPARAPGELTRITSHVDVMPTLLELAGAGVPAEAYSDGHSLLGPDPNEERLAAQCDADRIHSYGVVFEEGIARYDFKRGRLSLAGGEDAAGKQLAGAELGALGSRAAPHGLKVIQSAGRWGGVSAGP